MPLSRALALLLAILCLCLAQPALANDLRPLVDRLGEGGFTETRDQVRALAETGDPAVAPVLRALGEGDLHVRKSDGRVVMAVKQGSAYHLVDPLTGEALGEAVSGAIDKIRVNNSLRRAIASAIGELQLRSPNPDDRRRAANAVFESQDPGALPIIERALEAENDADVRLVMEQARAAAVLKTETDARTKIAAIEAIRDRGDRQSMAILTALAGSAEGEVQAAAQAAVSHLKTKFQLWSVGQSVWYGLSLGSVLLLAAIGLAITFGVMGVINMAHGEMVMIGAYTTFVVQEVIRTSSPALFEYSLLIALPLAFLAAAAVGMAIERGIIRYLYGRPLETLLATWGLSLILQQTVRTIFGSSNREVGNPDWMSGAFEVGHLTVTYSRLWIVVFCVVVFAVLIAVLRKTPFGLQMRAVTQNRPMASAMGIRTPWVDAMTFGLGSGIAGIAGVALSQIDNVSPNLGQGYIIDSFMVVVFGGVGNLWGTLVGAFTLGIANKFLEPFAGAVLGKILVLVFIILFIQKRPRGLFALKGRAVDA